MKKSNSWLLTHSFIKIFLIALILPVTFYSQAVYADITIPDINTMLKNLSTSVPQLMQLTTAISYVMGMVFIIRGLMALKEHGEHRTAGGKGGVKGGLILLGVGTALLYLPSSVQAGLTTFWTNPAPFSYDTGDDQQWADFVNSIFLIVQLIGTIAFIRGLIILSHGGEHQQGGFGKAMAFIVSGILLINLYQFLQAVFTTLGLGSI